MFYPSKFAGKRQTICSYECCCKGTARKQIHEFVCQYCGKQYKTAYKDRDTYCSRACSLSDIDSYRVGTVASATIECEQCGKQVLAVDAYNGRTCSEKCYRQMYSYHCMFCGQLFVRADKRAALVCDSEVCRDAYAKHRWREYWAGNEDYRARSADRSAIRRALTSSDDADNVERMVVYERDNWTCHLCGKRIDRLLKWPDAMSASIDHVIPLSLGGAHTYDNIKAAHLKCNIGKGGANRCSLADVDRVGGFALATMKLDIGG
jgi:5-methylcytosine-specific restriction endonuclease McrA